VADCTTVVPPSCEHRTLHTTSEGLLRSLVKSEHAACISNNHASGGELIITVPYSIRTVFIIHADGTTVVTQYVDCGDTALSVMLPAINCYYLVQLHQTERVLYRLDVDTCNNQRSLVIFL